MVLDGYFDIAFSCLYSLFSIHKMTCRSKSFAVYKAVRFWVRWRFLESVLKWWMRHHYRYIEVPKIARYLGGGERAGAGEKRHPAHDSVSVMPYTKDTLKAFDRVLIERVNFLQFGVSSEDAKYLVVKPHHAGLSAQILNNLNIALILGSLYNRTVLFDEALIRYNFPFKPITNHALAGVEGNVEGNIENIDKDKIFRFQPSPERILFYNTLKSRLYWLPFETVRSIGASSSSLLLPEQFQYTFGLLLNCFLTLKEEYKVHIDERKKKIGFPADTPVIGLHIRRGDQTDVSNSSARSHMMIPSAVYISCVEALAEVTGCRTVFVTTDSPSALQQLPKDSGITFIYDDEEIRYDNCNADMVRDNSAFSRQETMTAVKNIYMLGDCDYIVGGRASFYFAGAGISYHRNKKLGKICVWMEQGEPYVRFYMTGYQEALSEALVRRSLSVESSRLQAKFDRRMAYNKIVGFY